VTKERMIIVSGYFNPVHKGHIEYFEKAGACGNKLCVIVNSDFQRELKASKEFMLEAERLLIVKSLRAVDVAEISIDRDRTVCETLRRLHSMFSWKFDLAFANGGDQTNQTIPEREVCEELGIELLDGLGDKVQSSSWLLEGE
jgi:cytidyltransferase-like protein